MVGVRGLAKAIELDEKNVKVRSTHLYHNPNLTQKYKHRHTTAAQSPN